MITGPNGVLCPIIAGRDEELAALAAHLEATLAGSGRLVGVIGEAGIGKSALIEAITAQAGARGVVVPFGRAVPAVAPLPFRPLSEAVLALDRAGSLLDVPELAGFRGQLGRLVPELGTPAGGADESPVLMGEAVVRLLRVLARGNGAVLVLEDLHWADAETLAVVDYLADALAGENVLCLVTARPSDDDPLERLWGRRAGSVLRLRPLPPSDVARMLDACLDRTPADLLPFIVEHADGVPFLVEELLAGLVVDGSLVNRDGAWQAASPLTPAVPTSFADSVRHRLADLDPGSRQVLTAAAVLGRSFDWELLPGMVGADGSTVVAALRSAFAAHLIAVDGPDFRFRHALTREAVLAELLPPERAALARTAVDVVRRAHPGLPGPWCELVAELAAAGGDIDTAVARFTESATRALHRGALATAEQAATNAVELAGGRAAEAEHVLVRVLTQVGKAARAMEVGAALLQGATDPDLLLVLARAALMAGDRDAAGGHLDRATAVSRGDQRMSARLDAVAAHLALERNDPTGATRLALAAVDAAGRAGMPEVQCEALEVLGRLARTRGLAESLAHFERAARIAEAHNLFTWRLRAEQELVALDPNIARVRAVRDRAAASGALVTVAQMDLRIADSALLMFDHDLCLDSARRCVDASTRFGLAILPVARMWLAGAHALGGREAEMEKELGAALAATPDDPRLLADVWGRVRATLAAVREDRAALLTALDRSMTHVRAAPPTESQFIGQVWWAVVHAIEDGGAKALAELAATPLVRVVGTAPLDIVVAVAQGREGNRAAAEEAFARLEGSAVEPGLGGAYWFLVRLAAEAAIRDGWGTPEPWLREADAFFAANGYEQVARACRALLRTAGVPVPRRGRGDAAVPAPLRAMGVTSRELDIGLLVAEGLSNKAIAERLQLSIRTVENHVSRLLARTATTSRTELAAALTRYREPQTG